MKTRSRALLSEDDLHTTDPLLAPNDKRRKSYHVPLSDSPPEYRRSNRILKQTRERGLQRQSSRTLTSARGRTIKLRRALVEIPSVDSDSDDFLAAHFNERSQTSRTTRRSNRIIKTSDSDEPKEKKNIESSQEKSENEDSGKELLTENQPSDDEFNAEQDVSDQPEATSDEEVSGPRLRRRTNRNTNYSRSTKSNDKSYSLRKKKTVDYSVFYMPRQAASGSATDLGFGLQHNQFDESLFRFHPRRDEQRERRRINDSSDDEDDTPAFLRGRNVTVPKSNRGFLPSNILELLNYQENALLNQLPEDERTVYEKDKITFLGCAKKDDSIENTSFEMIGGLDEYIQSLKEMIIMPLIYPEILQTFKITPPRGVLFHGPPGTGKTMMARALASNCSTPTQKVAFFVRKGADILSKWVGEAEKQLRQLFEQAKAWQPSIIFFDEIDGLAPARSMSKQDQTHSSVVSTLLALMDGLDSRGQVIVIGATNRLDALDPALRRPGRFDREFYFPLPDAPAREKILQVYTKEWQPALTEQDIKKLTDMSHGFSGADLKALCVETALASVRRCFPQIYTSLNKVNVDVNHLKIEWKDILSSFKKLTPSSQRSGISISKDLPDHLHPLLSDHLTLAEEFINQTEPLLQWDDTTMPSLSINTLYKSAHCRLLISGPPGYGQDRIGAALFSLFEKKKWYTQVCDVPTLFQDGMRTPESVLIQFFSELKRHKPSILYLPDISEWWESVSVPFQLALLKFISHYMPSHCFLLATANHTVPNEIQNLFTNNRPSILNVRLILNIQDFNEQKRQSFFNILLSEINQPTKPKVQEPIFACEAAPISIQEVVCTENSENLEELTELTPQEEQVLRKLRHELRGVIDELRKDRTYKDFVRPVSVERMPDYYEIVKSPMTLSMMYLKINSELYWTPRDFLADVDLILQNARLYHGDESEITEKAKSLKDQAEFMLGALDADFVWECKQVFLKYRVKQLLKNKAQNQKDVENENALRSLDEISTFSDESPPDPTEIEPMIEDDEHDLSAEIEQEPTIEIEDEHSTDMGQNTSTNIESDAPEIQDDYLSFLNLPATPMKPDNNSDVFIKPSEKDLHQLMETLLQKTEGLTLDALEEYLLGILTFIKSMDNEMDRSMVLQSVYTKICHT